MQEPQAEVLIYNSNMDLTTVINMIMEFPYDYSNFSENDIDETIYTYENEMDEIFLPIVRISDPHLSSKLRDLVIFALLNKNETLLEEIKAFAGRISAENEYFSFNGPLWDIE